MCMWVPDVSFDLLGSFVKGGLKCLGNGALDLLDLELQAPSWS